MSWVSLWRFSPHNIFSRQRANLDKPGCQEMLSSCQWDRVWGQGCVFVLPKCHLGKSLLPFGSQVLSWAGGISSAFPNYVLRNLRGVKTCSEKKKRKGGEIIAHVFRRYPELQCSLCRTSQVSLVMVIVTLRWGSHEQLSQTYLIMEQFGKSCLK